tara:strand:- start:284 stop:535 length:252 start_codon:yes stop_codon:yes gene_type:complete
MLAVKQYGLYAMKIYNPWCGTELEKWYRILFGMVEHCQPTQINIENKYPFTISPYTQKTVTELTAMPGAYYMGLIPHTGLANK